VSGKIVTPMPAALMTYRVGVGIAGEYASIHAHLKNRPLDDDNDLSDAFATDTHHACHKFQISPGFELGVFAAKRYYLGFVLNKHYTSASSAMKTSVGNNFSFDHELKLKSYVNLFLKFGYKIIPNMMCYGLVGPSFANWSHNSKTYLHDAVKNTKKVYALSEMNSKTTGFGVGGGVEYSINDKYSVSLDYTLSMHRAKNLSYKSFYNEPVSLFGAVGYDATPADVQKSVRLTYSTIGVRLSYFFSF
jgi:opacity protein-like surface antigen